MNIISNCPLCEQHSLHVIGQGDEQMLQCLNCGYVSTSKFIGVKEDNEEYKNLTDEMKNWSKEFNGRIWIPSMMTLPIGMLYPQDDKDGNMKWYFAEMIDIPKEEQENYPNGQGGFYETMYDVDNTKEYDEFFEGMVELNEKMKSDAENQDKTVDLKLPKLKKIR